MDLTYAGVVAGDEVGDVALRIGMVEVALFADPFVLEAAEDTFDDGVFPAGEAV